MSEPTNVDNQVVIAERGDQRIAIPKRTFLKRSFSPSQTNSLILLEVLVTRSLRGQEGQEVRIPKQHWAEVQPLIRSVQIQPPPPPSTSICDTVKAIIYAVIFIAVVIFLKVNGFL
ncbi:hypothetical protein ARMSODRAFT_135513 [Armillaria solidipes]|uniref:Uncharacterized protein n=1 Tax=Armillaria solidipes TaxID=1076256 RepID=A0A2H3ANK2_9AGAR|nr:hypothetical protein ARMSODRAFT_135513 [Armillaria solidipes]